MTFQLNSGHSIPKLGLGTWLSEPNQVKNAVQVALECGYRHIDAAAIYENENEVGDGIKASGVPREDIFLTSKLWNNSHKPEDVEAALDKTLTDLQTNYLDLYLIHWPVAFQPGKSYFPRDESGLVITKDVTTEIPLEDTWKAMEKLLSTGKVKSIGVSNFDIGNLERIIKVAEVKPAVNQIEAHPYLLQPKLQEFHKKHGILATAYSPLGNNVYGKARVIDDPKIGEIAEKVGKPVANVLVSFLIQKGFVVVPKSVTPSRIKSNLEVVELPQDAVQALEALNTDTRYNDPIDWGRDIFGEQGGDENALKIAKSMLK